MLAATPTTFTYTFGNPVIVVSVIVVIHISDLLY
jgi:hypothetical protein